MMTRIEGIFINILETQKPDAVAYKVSTAAARVDQIAYLHYPLGILNRICADRDFTTFEFNPASYTPKKLGYDKSLTKEAACDQVIGVHAPYWSNSRFAALSAWAAICSM